MQGHHNTHVDDRGHSKHTAPGSVATSAPTTVPDLSAMMVAALTNRAVIAILVTSANQNMSSGDMLGHPAKGDATIQSGTAGSLEAVADPDAPSGSAWSSRSGMQCWR